MLFSLATCSMRLLTSSSTPCVKSSSLPFCRQQLFVDQDRDELGLALFNLGGGLLFSLAVLHRGLHALSHFAFQL